MKRIFLIVFLLFNLVLNAQVTTFKLSNGLAVIINEDHRTPSILGCVVVRAGSVNDPADATGLAHYLEHVMFKGTQNVGTIDWAKESVHYKNIIALYDELAKTPEEGRAEIQKKINEESLLAAKYTVNNEYSNLIQAIGGTSLNAGTGQEVTYFHNVLPSFQLKKWLELQKDRFECPVFRGFQAELENVYEEKNMYSDSPFEAFSNLFSNEFFGENNPYAIPIIGKTEHLKSPSLSKLIEFYNTYYIPSNMALVLAGDVDVEAAKVMAENTLGKLEAKGDLKQPEYSFNKITEDKVVKVKLTPYPTMLMGYSCVSSQSEDVYKLEVLANIMNNDNSTGLLDKIMLDGDALQASMSVRNMRRTGYINIMAIPVFDMARMSFASFSTVEKAITEVIEQVKNGKIEDWLLQSVKDKLVMEFEMGKESNYRYGMMLVQAYGNGVPIDEVTSYADKINAITKQDVVDVAKKYLSGSSIKILSSIGTAKKDKLTKPEFKPLEPSVGQSSEFAKAWLKERVDVPAFKPIDFEKDLKKGELAKGVDFYYATNPDNDIFSLTIQYGVGKNDIKGLEYSVNLMNKAGVMAMYSPYQLKREFSKLGCEVNFYCGDNVTAVNLSGKESNLAKACQLLSKTYLMPSLDEKQLNSVIGGVIGARRNEAKDKSTQSDALNDYLLYGKQSSYIDRLTNEEIMGFTVSNLAAKFIAATQYETSVHYTGKLPYDQIKNALVGNLAFPANLKPSKRYQQTPTAEYAENTIFLVNNKDARQADIYLFVKGSTFTPDQQAKIDAFNEYFGGGFNGLVLQELRELRSFAYTASANYIEPALPGQNARLSGYIGTQGDKTLDAFGEFVKLISNMPLHENRIESIKDYLYQATVSASPMVRSRTQLVERWIKQGYTHDPRIDRVKEYSNLTFKDIEQFYNQFVKGKPIAAAIIVNTKQIDIEKLKTLGKVVKLNMNDLFKY